MIRFASVCSHVNDLLFEINAYLPNFPNRVIGIINFDRLSPILSPKYELAFF